MFYSGPFDFILVSRQNSLFLRNDNRNFPGKGEKK
jgi:hypothetical protein